MRETRDIMGMPVVIEVVGEGAKDAIERAFEYFDYVDKKFSTYKDDSEISKINRKELQPETYSADMREVLQLCEETKRATEGCFDIERPDGSLDPSGLVKGWAIRNAARLIESLGHLDFYVDAGGDIQTGGKNAEGKEWSIGIRNPFSLGEIVKVIYPGGRGIATSGTYLRGRHIYDPRSKALAPDEIASLTVIGPDIYEADRFATAAFAMGREGIGFIESLDGFEGYMIDSSGTATMTSGFERYTHESDR